MSERDLDVVVLGATGVTGRRVAAHLAARAAASGVRWAAAARDADRATTVLGGEGVHDATTLTADIGDDASLRALASRARVVLDLVGPYTLYGRPVIEACVQEGAHYVDLTGEIPFLRTIIDELDAPARAAGVKVVQVCGFESLPPDLSIALAASAARERWDERLAAVDVEVALQAPPGPPHPSDMISGGTLQSLLAVAAGDDADTISDPAALIADAAVAAAVRRVSPIALAPRLRGRETVIAPMAPAPFINPAVVHRSAVLAAEQAGEPPSPFRYREGVLIPGGALALPLRGAVAATLTGTQVGLRAFARARRSVRSPLASALARVAPGSGFGPDGARMERWSWRMTTRARTASGRELRVEVDADGHPGYLTTARMLAEVGMLLAQDGRTPALAGCLTPAAALGTGAAEQLAAAGARFAVVI